jgi:small subunit ribosomal protein S16
VSVRIRMKKMGRPHRPFFRLCAMDIRAPRDGKVIEELGYYDPMIRDVDARAILNGERIAHWLSVGAQPSDKVKVLIKKYGPNGTHLEAQKAALERRKAFRPQPPAPYKPPPKPEPVAEAPAEEGGEPGVEQPAEQAAE